MTVLTAPRPRAGGSAREIPYGGQAPGSPAGPPPVPYARRRWFRTRAAPDPYAPHPYVPTARATAHVA
ncbi:hypothetical protein, partial [Streptomyces albireticuli]|uniref:hypothetical protein n=1 Tax=Streptomyces albireticuli TaxID=1940 RepID=UPI001B80D8A8